jgi:cholest-4-en-3-one 26-monooxygenase
MSIAASTIADWPAERVFDPALYGNGDPSTFGLPLDFYERLRSEQPCFKVRPEHPMLIEELWVVSRYDDICAVDRDPDTWSAGGGFVNIWTFTPITTPEHGGKPAMIIYDGEPHREHRQLIGRGFRPAMVRKLEEKLRAFAVEVVESAIAEEEFDFIEAVAHTMPMRALGDVLGVPEQDRAKFFNYVDVFASPFDQRVTPSFDAVAEAVQGLWDYALELSELRAREPGDDVMSVIAAAHGDEALSDAEIQGTVSLLASGAAESTRSALGHGMHELMRNTEMMDWIMARADDIPPTAPQEIIRIATPFTHLVRTATKDVEMHGQTIEAGEQVAMLFASGNFDPDGISDPRTFDLSRDPNPHVSFGRGPHSCLGKHIAALEIKVLLEEFFKRIKSITPLGPPSYVNDNYTRGIYSLPVKVEAAE